MSDFECLTLTQISKFSFELELLLSAEAQKLKGRQFLFVGWESFPECLVERNKTTTKPINVPTKVLMKI